MEIREASRACCSDTVVARHLLETASVSRVRRDFLKASAGALVAAAGAARSTSLLADAEPALPGGATGSASLEALPDKLPLIRRTWRPPNFETPLELLDSAYTPNEAFFVRYHLAAIPRVSTSGWTLSVGGAGAQKPLVLDWDTLRRDFEAVELSALCLCSGNRRGFSDPHVPGIQWGHGAMGNARWKGVRLRDVLARAGVAKDAVEVAFDGADSAVLDKTPDFIKSLPLWKALDENTLLAYEMNGAPLPHWNGYPLRLVVPGWTATYWIKHLTSIQVLNEAAKGFWMATAYRLPKGRFPLVDRFISQETDANTPITEMVVSSLITAPQAGTRLQPGAPLEVRGLAWDGGHGIADVLVSADGGGSWRPAELGPDQGRFSWRQWRIVYSGLARGTALVMARASNLRGATQTPKLIFNPAGYHNNVMQRVAVEVT